MTIQIHGREKKCGVPAWTSNEAYARLLTTDDAFVSGKNVLDGGIVGLRPRQMFIDQSLACEFDVEHACIPHACIIPHVRPPSYLACGECEAIELRHAYS